MPFQVERHAEDGRWGMGDGGGGGGGEGAGCGLARKGSR